MSEGSLAGRVAAESGPAADRTSLAPADRRLSLRRAPYVSAAGVRVEALTPEIAALHREALLDLAAHSIEPNPFFDPDFLFAAARHLKGSPVMFVVARGLVGGRMRVMGLLPMTPGRRVLTGVARGWTHPYLAFGAPLIGTARAAEALEALLGWVAQNVPRAGGLLLTALAREGALAMLLRRAALAHGRGLRLIDPRQRAVLRFERERAAPPVSKNLRRLQRRLAEQGDLAFELIEEPERCREGFERFLALEAAGWKGERGTALISNPDSAAFAREAVGAMARRGAARIAALTLDDAPVALGVVLISGGVAAFWKIAHDPAHARFSPGAQLSMRLAEAVAGDPALTLLDSCAAENHAMIDQLWPARMSVVDILAGLPAGGRFHSSVRREHAVRAARAFAKRVFLAASGRKAY